MFFTIQHKGRAVPVSLQQQRGGTYFEIAHNGLIYRWVVRYAKPDDVTGVITCGYYLQLLTLEGIVVPGYEDPRVQEYVELDYDRFANMQGLATLHITIFLHLINGLMYRVIDPVTGKPFGVRPFKADGTFYQPTVFDVAVTVLTEEMGPGGTMQPVTKKLEVITHEGIGPFEFSIDGENWQNSPVYAEVPGSVNRLIVRDSEGNYNVALLY